MRQANGKKFSFGFTEKAVKSASMRLGKDAIIFTKTGRVLGVGQLSQTSMDCVCGETVIIPLV